MAKRPKTRARAYVVPPKVRIVIWTDEDPVLIHLLMRNFVKRSTWRKGTWECNFINRKRNQKGFYCYNTYVLRPSQVDYVVESLLLHLKLKAKIEFYASNDWSWKPA